MFRSGSISRRKQIEYTLYRFRFGTEKLYRYVAFRISFVLFVVYLFRYLGMRYGKLQMKLTLARILMTYKLTLDPEMEEHLEIDTKSQHFLLQHKNKIRIRFERLLFC